MRTFPSLRRPCALSLLSLGLALTLGLAACGLAACEGEGPSGRVEGCTLWARPIEGFAPGGVALFSRRDEVALTGAEEGRAAVATFDACSGEPRDRRGAALPAGDEGRVSLQGALATSSGLAIAGSIDDGGGLGRIAFADYRSSPTGPEGTLRLAAGEAAEGKDELYDMVELGGRLFGVGTRWAAGVGAPFLVEVREGAPGCRLPVADLGAARAVAVDGQDLVVPVSGTGETLRLVRVRPSACEDLCACAPASSTELGTGLAGLDIRGAAAADGAILLAGFATVSAEGDRAGVLLRLSATALLATALWNPTPDFDGFAAVSLGGGRAVAAGIRGWEGAAGFEGATGALVSFPIGFADGAAPAWVTELAGSRLAPDLALEAGGGEGRGLFVLASLPAGSALLRCEAETGRCPPLPPPAGMDAGVPTPDAGPPRMDAGPPTPDAGPPGADAGLADAGPPPGDAGPSCITYEDPGFFFEVTESDITRKILLDLPEGQTFRTLRLEFEVNFSSWNGTCFNPAVGRRVPTFNSLVILRRGTEYCRGGNFFWSNVRGGVPSDTNIWVRSGYRPQVQPRCSGYPTEGTEIIRFERHSLPLGDWLPVRFDHEFVTQRLDLDIAGQRYSGTNHPSFELRAEPGSPLYLVFSFDRYLECYDDSGSPDPSADCCYAPSTGWQYRNLRWEACR